MTPSPEASPIVWAVYLGADTSRRLAAQWRISFHGARARLRHAAKKGTLRVVGKRKVGGVYSSVYESILVVDFIRGRRE